MLPEQARERRSLAATWCATSALLAVAVGLLVLVGWLASVEALKRIAPGLVAMNPMTALLFVASGAALWWQRLDSAGHPGPGRLLAGAVVAVAVLKLGGLLLGWSASVDTWLFASQLNDGVRNLPNRMAPNTTVGFLLIGLSLGLLDTTTARGRRPAEWLAALAALIALLAALGYAYHVDAMYGVARYIPMALHTAAAFLILALGVLAARPRAGWMAVFTGTGPGGAMARLMLPAIVLMLATLGWLRVEGQRHGLFGLELGVTFYTIAVIVVCIALVAWGAHSLNHAAAARLRVVQQREVALADLQRSEIRNRSIIDTAQDAFVSIDAAGMVSDWNAAAETMFGWPRGDCIGRRLSDTIIPPQHRDAHERGLRHFAATGTGMVLDRRIEISALRRDGSEFPVELTIWPLKVGDAHVFNAFIRDITERRQAEDSIHQLNDELQAKASQLEHSNRELEAFSYSVSHDLRAPLRHIDGYARMLHEDAGEQLDADMRRYLDEIGGAARQMGALIDDLLAFSRLGRKPIERLRVDMRELVGQALHEVAVHADPRVRIAALPDAHVDPVLLKQVWVNLLSNALKYSAPRGDAARIEVTGERVGKCVRYHVSDNGVGFDMRYADKLFGVFQRLHAQDEFDGTGVGLAIVQQIVVRHGGSIGAEAEPGLGATFTFELPACGEDPGSMSAMGEQS